MKIFVISPKARNFKDNGEKGFNKDNGNVQEVVVDNLYVLMAQYLEGVKEVIFL